MLNKSRLGICLNSKLEVYCYNFGVKFNVPPTKATSKRFHQIELNLLSEAGFNTLWNSRPGRRLRNRRTYLWFFARFWFVRFGDSGDRTVSMQICLSMNNGIDLWKVPQIVFGWEIEPKRHRSHRLPPWQQIKVFFYLFSSRTVDPSNFYQ